MRISFANDDNTDISWPCQVSLCNTPCIVLYYSLPPMASGISISSGLKKLFLTRLTIDFNKRGVNPPLLKLQRVDSGAFES